MQLTKRILVVDDEQLILYGFLKGLRSERTKVKTVGTGEDALKEISSGYYNLCFLDIFLPDSNGLELMKKIKEISPQTKVVIMTASHVDDKMKKEIDAEAYLFLPKPFDLSHIKSIAKQALK